MKELGTCIGKRTCSRTSVSLFKKASLVVDELDWSSHVNVPDATTSTALTALVLLPEATFLHNLKHDLINWSTCCLACCADSMYRSALTCIGMTCFPKPSTNKKNLGALQYVVQLSLNRRHPAGRRCRGRQNG